LWALAIALGLSACAREATDQLTVISVSQGDIAQPRESTTLTSATAAPARVMAPSGVVDTRAARLDQECTRIEKLRCQEGIGSLDACNRCRAHAQPGCGDGVCSGTETDATCGADCGCQAEGHACGTVAPFGCYCDADCAATGDCCADVEEVCQ
jgi:hypothetical protein